MDRRTQRRRRRITRGAREVPERHPGRRVQRDGAGSPGRLNREIDRLRVRRMLRGVRHERHRARGPQEDRAPPRSREQAREARDARRDRRTRRVRTRDGPAVRPSNQAANVRGARRRERHGSGRRRLRRRRLRRRGGPVYRTGPREAVRAVRGHGCQEGRRRESRR